MGQAKTLQRVERSGAPVLFRRARLQASDGPAIQRPQAMRLVSRGSRSWFDERREFERVLTHEALDQFGIPPLQRFNDAHVLNNRVRRAITLRDRPLADRSHMQEKVLDRVEDELRCDSSTIDW
jgi:hypothetical protein